MLTPTDSNEPYTEWLDFVLSQKTLPQTISTSYADDEQTGMLCTFCGEAGKVDIRFFAVPVSFAKRVCNGFAQLGTLPRSNA